MACPLRRDETGRENIRFHWYLRPGLQQTSIAKQPVGHGFDTKPLSALHLTNPPSPMAMCVTRDKTSQVVGDRNNGNDLVRRDIQHQFHPLRGSLVVCRGRRRIYLVKWFANGYVNYPTDQVMQHANREEETHSQVYIERCRWVDVCERTQKKVAQALAFLPRTNRRKIREDLCLCVHLISFFSCPN